MYQFTRLRKVVGNPGSSVTRNSFFLTTISTRTPSKAVFFLSTTWIDATPTENLKGCGQFWRANNSAEDGDFHEN